MLNSLLPGFIGSYQETILHIVDPRNPGAADEIIHLGDYWDEAGMRANKKEILALNKEVGRLFRRAYAYLAGARLFLDEVESYYQDTGALDGAGLDRLTLDLTHEIFEGQSRPSHRPRARHLFATAITPDGPVNYLETIVGPLKKRYIINGDDGTGKYTLVRRLMEAALMRGYDVEAYHCALDPREVEHLVIPALSVAVVNGVESHFYDPKPGDRVVDTMDFVNPSLNVQFLPEKQKSREMYRRCMEQAVWFISRAKQTHDEMETYYVPHMNFELINARRESIIARIFGLAREYLGAGQGGRLIRDAFFLRCSEQEGFLIRRAKITAPGDNQRGDKHVILQINVYGQTKAIRSKESPYPAERDIFPGSNKVELVVIRSYKAGTADLCFRGRY